MIEAQAFGINLVLPDEFDLVGLSPPSTTAESPPTVVYDDPTGAHARWAGAQPTRTREAREQAVTLSVDHDPERGYLLQATNTGAALVSADGLDVRCAPDPASPDWKALLAGQILPLVATVRGLEVFHAAGLVRKARTYLLVGARGVGKTSLAAHLVIAGAQLLSDDVVALDDSLLAHPGMAVLHVRDGALQRLARGSIPGLARLTTVGGRTRLAAASVGSAQPLAAIYLLERARSGRTIEAITDPSPFSLIAATFNLSVQTPIRLVHQLDLCARLAASVPIFRVRIVPGRGAAELAQTLSTHINECELAGV